MTYGEYLQRATECVDAAQTSHSVVEREKLLLSAIVWHELAVTERDSRRFDETPCSAWVRWPVMRTAIVDRGAAN
jgi:hypothetical protein